MRVNLILWVFLWVSLAEAQFEFNLPSNLSLSLSGDSQSTRSTSLVGSINVYSNNFLDIGWESTKINIDESESYKINNFIFGYSSDPLNVFQFKAEYSRTRIEDEITAQQGRLYGLLNFEKFSFGLVIGAQSTQFLTTPTAFNNENTKTVSGTNFGFVGDLFLSRRWSINVSGSKYGFDQDLSILDNESISFFVPIESLNILTGYIKYEFTIGVNYNYQKFALNLRSNLIKNAVNDTKNLTNSIGFNYLATKKISFLVEFANSQSLNDEESDSSLKSYMTGVSYSF